VSSIAVAHEVAQMGGRSLACLNARDRNLLGFRRDLLTAAAYGVDQFLFVYGDRPSSGARTGQLTVRTMIDEIRAFAAMQTLPRPFRVGVSAGAGPLAPWKREADFLFAQVQFSLDELLRWRSTIDFDGPVYAGIMAVPSIGMARKIGADIPQLRVPDAWLDAIDRDPAAGVRLACDLVRAVERSDAFAGVHLIPVSKYREVAATLEAAPGT
jgi:5,10-methylenetetrahydrofolate reductase